MALVYHWKHGWIPLDHGAALKKAKGDHALADKMLADAPHANGIQSRQDVAKAIRDLPNVPDSHRSEAMNELRTSSAKHDSADLLPRGGSITRPSHDSEHQFQMKNEKGRDAVRVNDHSSALAAKSESQLRDILKGLTPGTKVYKQVEDALARRTNNALRL